MKFADSVKNFPDTRKYFPVNWRRELGVKDQCSRGSQSVKIGEIGEIGTNSRKFPANSLFNRENTPNSPETGSPETASTANQSQANQRLRVASELLQIFQRLAAYGSDYPVAFEGLETPIPGDFSRASPFTSVPVPLSGGPVYRLSGVEAKHCPLRPPDDRLIGPERLEGEFQWEPAGIKGKQPISRSGLDVNSVMRLHI